MATLHIVRKSAFTTNDFSQCVDFLAKNDELVLVDDGCYNLNHPSLIKLLNSEINTALKVVQKHAQARGINVYEKATAIDMKALVELTFSLDRVITWQ